MQNLEVALVVGIITIILAALKIVDCLVRKRIDAEISAKLADIERSLKPIHESSQKIFDMHNKFHTNGTTPLWYAPSKWGEAQEEILRICHRLETKQANMAEILDWTEKKEKS